MALNISFRSGKAQSEQAASYYQEAAGQVLDCLMPELEEFSYHMDRPLGSTIRLRVWCRQELREDQLHGLFDRIIGVNEAVQSLESGPVDHDMVPDTLAEWLRVNPPEQDLFCELTVIDPFGLPEERPRLSLGIQQGRTILVSSDRLLFSWLDQDLFGLALAGHGSYLVEVIVDHDLRIAS
ncbi:MAG: hypothetical protein R2817_01295 [Flavobacteriales bacterium]